MTIPHEIQMTDANGFVVARFLWLPDSLCYWGGLTQPPGSQDGPVPFPAQHYYETPAGMLDRLAAVANTRDLWSVESNQPGLQHLILARDMQAAPLASILGLEATFIVDHFRLLVTVRDADT